MTGGRARDGATKGWTVTGIPWMVSSPGRMPGGRGGMIAPAGRESGVGVQRIGATRWGRLLACLLVQAGLTLSLIPLGHARSMTHAVPFGIAEAMPAMTGMPVASDRPDRLGVSPHCNHGPGHDHRACHHGGDCCLQGACVAGWFIPPLSAGQSAPRRVGAPFGILPADSVPGVVFAPALPPPRQTA
jgi:hypothetical protein